MGQSLSLCGSRQRPLDEHDSEAPALDTADIDDQLEPHSPYTHTHAAHAHKLCDDDQFPYHPSSTIHYRYDANDSDEDDDRYDYSRTRQRTSVAKTLTQSVSNISLALSSVSSSPSDSLHAAYASTDEESPMSSASSSVVSPTTGHTVDIDGNQRCQSDHGYIHYRHYGLTLPSINRNLHQSASTSSLRAQRQQRPIVRSNFHSSSLFHSQSHATLSTSSFPIINQSLCDYAVTNGACNDSEDHRPTVTHNAVIRIQQHSPSSFTTNAHPHTHRTFKSHRKPPPCETQHLDVKTMALVEDNSPMDDGPSRSIFTCTAWRLSPKSSGAMLGILAAISETQPVSPGLCPGTALALLRETSRRNSLTLVA